MRGGAALASWTFLSSSEEASAGCGSRLLSERCRPGGPRGRLPGLGSVRSREAFLLVTGVGLWPPVLPSELGQLCGTVLPGRTRPEAPASLSASAVALLKYKGECCAAAILCSIADNQHGIRSFEFEFQILLHTSNEIRPLNQHKRQILIQELSHEPLWA